MIRIVAVGDTHTFQRELQVPEGDIFVHVGDMLRGGDLEELEGVAEWLHSLPHAHKVIIAGNHDGCFAERREEALKLLSNITYLEDSGAVIAGLRFWGSPWQPAYNDWYFNLPRGAALAAKWSQIPKNLDVLMTHGPPHGLGDRGHHGQEGAHEGCEELRSRVEQVQPRLHLFGHIHQDGGMWEQSGIHFANVTTWECERAPTVIDIDPERIARVHVPPSRI